MTTNNRAEVLEALQIIKASRDIIETAERALRRSNELLSSYQTYFEGETANEHTSTSTDGPIKLGFYAGDELQKRPGTDR